MYGVDWLIVSFDRPAETQSATHGLNMPLSLQEKLEKELEAAQVSTLQVMDSWRRILRISKTEELRRELEILSQQYERDVARRDTRINDLLLDLKAAEEQILYAQRQHMRAMDELIDIQDTRPLQLEKEFKRELRVLEEEFATERAELTARHRTFRTELLHVIKAIREEEEMKVASATAEYEQVREGVKRRNLERMHILQGDMDNLIESFERRFEEAHLAYLANTDQRTQDYKLLSERGQHDTSMNERQQRALRRLNKLLQLWRSKLNMNARESEERNQTLQEEKNTVQGHLEKLKAEMAKSRALHMARMKALSTSAAAAKSRLADATSTAQHILTLAETVRALESEAEKVYPFAPTHGTLPATSVGTGGAAVASVKAETAAECGTSVGAAAGVDLSASLARTWSGVPEVVMGQTLPPHPSLQDTRAAIEAEGLPLDPDLAAPGTGQALAEAETLHHFYGRYNKALLEQLALERARDALKAEQAELQLVLQQVLDQTGVPASAVDGPNALLVVNGRVGADSRMPPVRVGGTGVIYKQEASQVSNTYAKGASVRGLAR